MSLLRNKSHWAFFLMIGDAKRVAVELCKDYEDQEHAEFFGDASVTLYCPIEASTGTGTNAISGRVGEVSVSSSSSSSSSSLQQQQQQQQHQPSPLRWVRLRCETVYTERER